MMAERRDFEATKKMKGLMGGYRWGTITGQESKSLEARVYLFKGTLNDLRLRYVKDFK